MGNVFHALRVLPHAPLRAAQCSEVDSLTREVREREQVRGAGRGRVQHLPPRMAVAVGAGTAARRPLCGCGQATRSAPACQWGMACVPASSCILTDPQEHNQKRHPHECVFVVRLPYGATSSRPWSCSSGRRRPSGRSCRRWWRGCRTRWGGGRGGVGGVGAGV